MIRPDMITIMEPSYTHREFKNDILTQQEDQEHSKNTSNSR